MKSRFSKSDQALGKVETILQISGYGGLHYTKHHIIPYIPKCKIYVEPFAGLGRIAKLVESEHIILNDMSDYAYDFLSKNFNAEITQMDFEECIKLYDSKDTFFFCDPPWRKNIYKNHSRPAFTEKNIKQYYVRLLDILKDVKAHWIITSDNAEVETGKALSKSGYENLVLIANDSKSKIFGHYPKVRMCSNRPFVKRDLGLDLYLKNTIHSIGSGGES